MSHEHFDMEDFFQTVKVGQKVEPFRIETYDPSEGGFGEVDLEKNMAAGKWTVLVFYPADFTFVCPTELADFAEKHAELAEMGVELVSVSTDTTFVHLAWRNDERLLQNVKFQMGADPTGNLSRYFDVWDPETGLALRGTFVINPEGVLVNSEVNFYNVGRNAEELVRKMKANVHLKANPAEACPARWEPGQKTLTPGADLVGKVYESLND